MDQTEPQPQALPEQEKQPFYVRLFNHKAFIPLAIFIGLIAVLAISSQFAERPPSISAITPDVAFPGDVVVITGNGFGSERKGSEVSIAGVRPTSTSYLEWSDRRISVRIPSGVGSGVVVVTTSAGSSKGVQFTNREHIPVILSGPAMPGQPYIDHIEPESGAVGTLVTIRGANFGLEQGKGKVYFTFAGAQGLVRSDSEDFTHAVQASEQDFDYELWSDHEIKVYVPDGASPGSLTISTERGVSNGVYFEVANPAGSKLFVEKKGYQIQYGVEVRNVRAGGKGSMEFWIPGVHESVEQKGVDYLHEPAPFWDNYRGVMRYHLEGIEPQKSIRLLQTVFFERYSVETRITESKVTNEYDKTRRLYKAYTIGDAIVPSDAEVIQKDAKAVVRGESSPYLKAKKIYQHLIKNLKYDSGLSGTNVLDYYRLKRADAYTYAVLYCAFLRAAGIPARPVAGFLVYDNKQTRRHYWAEFYLENFGWVPVDPALGAGNSGIPEQGDPAVYYFGNLDNQHISFSRGLIQIKAIDPYGKTVMKDRMYSFQTIHEEASSDVQGYTSVWQDINVVDWW
jgi:hypothetical protein